MRKPRSKRALPIAARAIRFGIGAAAAIAMSFTALAPTAASPPLTPAAAPPPLTPAAAPLSLTPASAPPPAPIGNENGPDCHGWSGSSDCGWSGSACTGSGGTGSGGTGSSGISGDCDDHKSKVCDKGNTNLAYNALSFGALNCLAASLGFEAQATNEFGDAVGLAGTARQLASMQVLFASFACGTSGHWNTGDCVTASGATFDIPITAKVYSVGNLTTPLATVTQTFSVPFRPSADNTNCTGTNAGKWFNPNGAPNLSGSLPNGGRCQNSIATILTFNFPAGTTLPDQVVWTVSYNTTHYGYSPVGEGAACYSTPLGCPYDSFNVGATDFPNAPYAGTDLPPANTAYSSTGQPPGPLTQFDIGTFRPLGAITTR
ncbi:hypothetical protein [Nocardia higoensis]|uniref:hypothetical protein n=1 Tax=Nocardia higoensis TaxID=228599 RepID=UPI0012F6635B|nr:hypothetical protein [Nocardia higoensis]